MDARRPRVGNTGPHVGDWDGVSARGAASIPGVTLSGVGASGGIRGAWVHGHGFGLLTPYCAVTLRSSARE